jgi:L-methionine (R)-S-oxide reductase
VGAPRSRTVDVLRWGRWSLIDQRRTGRYERIYVQLKDLIEDKSPSLVAAMATICAVLHHKMSHHFWTGFYFVSELSGEIELYIGPYQGPVACQVLRERGVCLHCVRTKEPVVVPDVEQFPGHVACDARSKSEIVLPVKKGDEVIAVLDVDSDKLAQFDDDDIAPLAEILSLLEPYL